jgi:BlaI family transcriptional regulator, penicillinase repressor
MPARPPPPTDGELEILRVCWTLGRARTRAIHEALNVSREKRSLPPLSFNTVATVLGKLVIKGFVRRFEDEPTRHEFEALYREEEISRSLAGDVMRRLFRGSIVDLVQNAFRDKKPSREELAELQKLIDQSAGRKP